MQLWKVLCDCGNETVVRKPDFKGGRHKTCGCRGLSDISIGRRFGSWTVVGKETRQGRTYLKTICDCGNESIVGRTDLEKGKSTKCLQCGYQRYESQSVGLSAIMRVYRSYEQNARSKQREFSLSVEEFKDLIFKPCTYSGHPPMSIGRGYSENASNIMYNGIDRIDNSKGYTIDNCVTCCYVCNRAKHSMKKDEWDSWITQFKIFLSETRTTNDISTGGEVK